MIKQSLNAKTPRKSASSVLETPTSRGYTPRPGSVRADGGKPVVTPAVKSTPKKEDEGEVSAAASVTEGDAEIKAAPPSAPTPQRRSPRSSAAEAPAPPSEEKAAEQSDASGASPAKKRVRSSPQRFSPNEVIQIMTAEKTKTSAKRRSKESLSSKTKERRSGERLRAKAAKKRVSFGSQLSPELFDKRLPPNSPLRRGAMPRRSLCLTNSTNHSLLRRASVIGLVLEEDPAPAVPSAKNTQATSSPGKKAQSPANKSPIAKMPYAAAGASPAKGKPESLKIRSEPSVTVQGITPTARRSSTATPLTSSTRTPSQSLTPTVQGRFSVSRIGTPSPTSQEEAAMVAPPLSVPVTPLRMKGAKTPVRQPPSAVKVLRKSGVSRASMKVKKSWADAVKFGSSQHQAAGPSRKAAAAARTTKRAAAKLQASLTPARKLPGHVSTGHADSPVTIVVGRAHQRKACCPAGAAPRLVANAAVAKKNLKMDEDLSGVADIFKTPMNERQRTTLVDDQGATPLGAPPTPAVEASLLKTPEEPGEMLVSPLTAASATKGSGYSSEAVKRLLQGDEESFVGEIPPLQIPCGVSSEQQCVGVETAAPATPKQKPEAPECLTGVERLMRTPRQKSEPLEDLRGKILKTPKQKPAPEEEECLTGVKRMMKTPKVKAEPVEDLRGKLLLTPQQKPEQPECLTGVKRIFDTPANNKESDEDLQGKLPDTLAAPEVADVSFAEVEEVPETPAPEAESVEDLAEMTDSAETPEGDGVEESLEQTPGGEGLQELKEEPSEPAAQMDTHEAEDDQEPLGCESGSAGGQAEALTVKEEDVCEEQPDVPAAGSEDGPSDVTEEDPQDVAGSVPEAVVVDVGGNEKLEDESREECESQSVAMETVSQTAEEEDVSEVVCAETAEECDSSDVVETVSQATEEETVQPEEQAESKVTEMDTATVDPDTQEESAPGSVESGAEDVQQEAAERSEEPEVAAPVRGRRGKKVEAAAPPAARQTTRSRKPACDESKDVELTVAAPSADAVKPKRGRNAKKAADEQVAPAEELPAEAPCVPSVAVDADLPANDPPAPQEEAAPKPKRGRKAKLASVEQSDPALAEHRAEDEAQPPQAEQEEDSNEGEKQEEEVPEAEAEAEEAAVEESVPEEDTAPKKTIRGRKAPMAEPEAEGDKQEEEEPAAAQVRGRRGKKAESSAPPPARQTTRGRRGKCNEAVDAEVTQEPSEAAAAPKPKRGRNAKQSADDRAEASPELPAETTPVPEASAESEQTPSVNAAEEEERDSSPVEEVAAKPKRGRKPKPAEEPAAETNEVESEQPQQAAAATVAQKPRRGRKAKHDEEHEEAAESVDTVQQTRAPTRATRGRNARQEEETTAVTADEPEPEPALVAVAEKPRRAGRTRKQDAESVAPVESAEAQEKPKQGRGRGKRAVTEEVAEVPEEKPEEVQEAEESKDAEAPVRKAGRARGAKAAAKAVEAEVIPPKRVCRGIRSAPADAAEMPAAPPKRGRRAATKPTNHTEEVPSSGKASEADANAEPAPAEDKKSVKWTEAHQVIEIPNPTPVKATRGRKAKLPDQDALQETPVKRGRRATEDAETTEEKDLSGKTGSEPIKRARRGAKAAEEEEEEETKAVQEKRRATSRRAVRK
ncbi:proliferation marker protein Ki-67 isoform X2 [Genypterus blacodes]